MDDLDEALEARSAVEIVTAPAFVDDLTRMAPLVDALVAGFAAGRVRMEDPRERLALVSLRERLVDVIGSLSGARDLLDHVFLQAAIDANASAIALPDHRQVRYEPARGEYITEARRMRLALHTLANLEGTVPVEEVDAALPEEVTVKPNHTKLNALSKKYGGAVAEAINANRTFITPAPERGRIRFPKEAP